MIHRRFLPLFTSALAALLAGIIVVTSACTHGWSHTVAERPGPAPGSAALQEPIAADHLDPVRLGAAIFDETNRVRREFHRRPFRWTAHLDEAADLQASSAALSQTSTHENFLPPLAWPADRARHVGLDPRRISENVAYLPVLNFPPQHGLAVEKVDGRAQLRDATTNAPVHPHSYESFARAVVAAWMNSPGHRANLLHPDFRYLGCSGRSARSLQGVDMIAAVQVFFTPGS